MLFRSLRRRGMTLLVSSHILAELEAYSTHMLILRGGQVVEHRALAQSLAIATPMELRTLDDAAAVSAFLAGQAAVSDVSVDGHTVRFALHGNEEQRAALLAALLATGARLSHFAAVAEDLQQSYINSLARGPQA